MNNSKYLERLYYEIVIISVIIIIRHSFDKIKECWIASDSVRASPDARLPDQHSSNLRLNDQNSVTISTSCTPDSQANQQGIPARETIIKYENWSGLSSVGSRHNCCFNKYPRMGKIISREFQVPRRGWARNNDHNHLHIVNQEEVKAGHHVTTHCRLSTVISADHFLTLCFFDINKVHMFCYHFLTRNFPELRSSVPYYVT